MIYHIILTNLVNDYYLLDEISTTKYQSFHQTIDYYNKQVLKYVLGSDYIQFNMDFGISVSNSVSENKDLQVKNAYFDGGTVMTQIARPPRKKHDDDNSEDSKDHDNNDKIYFVFI